MNKIAIVSGGFDPIHSGHIDYINGASLWADKLIVILNSDDWLIRKKGKYFQDWETRKTILHNLRSVHQVIDCNDDDGSVCDGIKKLFLKYKMENLLVFCNGGDRVPDNVPEVALCVELGIPMLFNVGGKKQTSSSEILKRWEENG